MLSVAVDTDEPDEWAHRCWCCGNLFPEVALTRMFSRPDVAVCSRCGVKLAERARRGRRRRWLGRHRS